MEAQIKSVITILDKQTGYDWKMWTNFQKSLE